MGGADGMWSGSVWQLIRGLESQPFAPLGLGPETPSADSEQRANHLTNQWGRSR